MLKLTLGSYTNEQIAEIAAYLEGRDSRSEVEICLGAISDNGGKNSPETRYIAEHRERIVKAIMPHVPDIRQKMLRYARTHGVSILNMVRNEIDRGMREMNEASS